MRRRQIQKRRRDVFFALVGLVGISLLAAAVAGSRTMIFVQVVSDALLIAYVGLLLRLRAVAAERSMKLRYLPDSRPGTLRQPSRPAYRSNALPAYGELALQRTAN